MKSGEFKSTRRLLSTAELHDVHVKESGEATLAAAVVLMRQGRSNEGGTRQAEAVMVRVCVDCLHTETRCLHTRTEWNVERGQMVCTLCGEGRS